jgi:alkylated DNA repair protein alkB family protein 4
LKEDENDFLSFCTEVEGCHDASLLLLNIPSACYSCGEFSGVSVYKDFVGIEEEHYVVSCVDQLPWALSQSGRLKQDYGPKVNFRKQKIRTGNFNGLPPFSEFIVSRVQKLPRLNTFHPVELCNLDYHSSRGAAIEPHMDDSWLWGNRLVTLNLLSDTLLTFNCPCGKSEVKVPLLRRSIIVVEGTARYKWLHSIKKDHISNRRIAVTLRELSENFMPGGPEEGRGRELLKISSVYCGTPVNEFQQAI